MGSRSFRQTCITPLSTLVAFQFTESRNAGLWKTAKHRDNCHCTVDAFNVTASRRTSIPHFEGRESLPAFPKCGNFEFTQLKERSSSHGRIWALRFNNTAFRAGTNRMFKTRTKVGICPHRTHPFRLAIGYGVPPVINSFRCISTN